MGEFEPYVPAHLGPFPLRGEVGKVPAVELGPNHAIYRPQTHRANTPTPRPRRPGTPLATPGSCRGMSMSDFGHPGPAPKYGLMPSELAALVEFGCDDAAFACKVAGAGSGRGWV